MSCWFPDGEGGVTEGAEGGGGGEPGVPGAGWMLVKPQQAGGEDGPGGGPGHLHPDHQDAAATAEVGRGPAPSEEVCVGVF